MSYSEDVSPDGDQAGSSDVESTPTIRNDDADVAQLTEQEMDDFKPSVNNSNKDDPNNGQETTAEYGEDGSELSSVDASSIDAIPRRAGSPIDSVASGHGYSPSFQVRSTTAAIETIF